MASLRRSARLLLFAIAAAAAATLIASPVVAQDSAGGVAADSSDEFDEIDAKVEDETEASEEAEDETAYKGIEVITVTANKKEENVQEVPISVTALGADFIEEAGITEFGQIQKFVPNLAILGGTDTRSTSIRIRGIGSVGTNAGIDPSVGLFIDGIYQGRAGMSMGDLIDLQGVEVLRGPQGTLYGKNTAAGVINIHTLDPAYDFSAMAEGTIGNYDYMNARFMVNVPIIDDRVATRATFYRKVRDGWDKNLYTGRRVNDENKWGIRNKWLLDLHDDVSIVLSGDYSKQQSDCCVHDIITYEGDSLLWFGSNPYTPPPAFPDRNLNPNFNKLGGYVNPTTPGGVWDRAHGAEVTEPKPELRNFDLYDGVVDVNRTPRNDITIWGIQEDMDVVFGDWGVNWLSAYRQYKSDTQFDGDFSQYDAVIGDNKEDLEQFSTELRLQSPFWDHIDFTSGLYFFYMNHYNLGHLGYDQDFADIFIPTQNKDGVTDFQPVANEDTGRFKTFSVAAYSEANIKFLEYWRLVGGLRVSWEKKTLVGSQISNSNLQAPPISGDDIYRDEERAVTNVSGTVKLAYQRDDWMLYASFASGFKSGGFNQLRTAQDVPDEFDDETAYAYEAGYRSTWFDRQLLFNLTGYFTDYRDFQAQIFSGTTPAILNAPGFYSYGFESEIELQPVDDLSWRTGIGFNMTEYQEFLFAENTIDNIVAQAATEDLAPFFYSLSFPDESTAQDLTGKRLDNAPRWDLSTSLHYERPILSSKVKWIFHTDYSFRSVIYLNQDLDPNLREDPLHLLGFNFGVAEEDNMWQVLAWVTNTLDQGYLINGLDVPVLGGFAGLHGPPREYGVTFRYRY